MADSRVEKFARILVDYSTEVKPGDRVAIYSSTAAIPAVQAIYARVLERGGYPDVMLAFPEQREILLRHASDDQLGITPRLLSHTFEDFDVLIKVRAFENTRELSAFPPARQVRYQGAIAPLIETQMRRGAAGELRWMSTIFPTHGYALEADMGLRAYQDFFFQACHADEDTADPVAYWQNIREVQQSYVERIQGHDQVHLRGPNVDLKLSIKDRIIMNACGQSNMPDGEVFTGPVEDSASGWVRFTYPTVYEGNVVEGVELRFEDGKVVSATADKNEAYLVNTLDIDPGGRYLGEFAIGLNYEIDRFTRSILFDEKIGGSFHLALGASYPETGGRNKSKIHWDMICDMRTDSEILLDGERVYKDGQFLP